MRMSRKVSAFINITLEKGGSLVKSEHLEGDDKHYPPVPYSSFVTNGFLYQREPFHRGNADNLPEGLVVERLTVGTAGSAGSHKPSCRIDLKIEILRLAVDLDKEFTGAVFPYTTLVEKVLDAQIKSADSEIYHQSFFGTGYTSPAKRSVRILVRPVDLIDAETFSAKFEGGVKILLFKILQERNSQ